VAILASLVLIMLSGNFHLAYSSSAAQEYPKEITWDDVKKCATGRWLSVEEIEFTITQKEELHIPIHKSRPTSPPPTGTLLLYDRSITRNYKDDGIVWVKKRESKKVREDHVKLRINGNYRVGGCYVHSQINSKFHRRAYHLLPNPEKPAVQIPNGRGGIASLILVHYLDTEVASSILAIWSAGNGVGLAPLRPRVARNYGKGSRNVSKKNLPPEVPGVPTLPSAAAPPSSVPPSHGDRGGPCDDLTYAHPDQMAAMAMLQQNFLQQQQQQYSHSHYNPVQDSSISPPSLSYHDQQGHYLIESNATDGLDVFWNMVMEDEEGIDLSDNRSGDASYLGNTSRCDKAGQSNPENEFSTANSSHVEPLGNNNSYDDYDMTAQEVAEVNSSLNELTKSVASLITDTGFEHNEQNGIMPATVPSSPLKGIPLPNIIDFTPEEAVILSPPKLNNVKVVISVSSNINSDPTVCGSFPGGNGEWRPVVAFLLFGALPQQLVPPFEEVSIATLTRITPQTFKFQAPPRGCSVGSHRLLIGALRGFVDDMSEEDVTRVIGKVVSQKWHLSTERDYDNLPVFYNRNDLTIEEPPFFVPLSQISSTYFDFKCNVEVTQPAIESSFTAQGNSDVDLPGPAPPPAMASIATALTDYPNPPLGTVVQKKINDDAPSVLCLRKRGNWCQQTAAIVGEAVADERQILASIERASEWAEDSVVEEVDRHCKIRFVEKLTNVIAGNEGVVESGPHQSNVQWPHSTFTSGSNADLDNSSIMTGNGENKKADNVSQNLGNEMPNGHSSCDGEKPKNGTGKAASAIEGDFMDDAQLQAMDDDALDNLLDSLLIRIVETLVEMSANDVELHDELNSVDRSGFTLLHYASLYNLQALVPVLLSRGAHTDITTVRGKLTPLHLSAGAGNSAITELLVRHGCAVNVLDSYGATPADHALRNGFADIYNFFQEKMGSDDKMKRLGGSITCNQDGSSSVNCNIPPPQSLDYNFSNELQMQKKIQENGSKRGSNAPSLEADNRKHLMQIAFQNLNLKDKLAINMLIKKHRKGVGIKSVHSTKQAGSKRKSSKSVPIKEVIYESEQLSDDSVEKPTKNKIEEGGSRFSKITLENIENSQLSASNEIFHEDSSEHDDGGVSSCVSDSDRESLDVAMSLMNQGELDDLEKSSKEISSDMRKWMLRRNYQSLREASQYLHHSLKKGQMGNILSFNQMQDNTNHRPPPMQTEKSSIDGAPTNPERSSIISSKKSIKNFKSQVFSELVIRKNLSRRNSADGSKKQNSKCD